jgi:hypothetical protein
MRMQSALGAPARRSGARCCAASDATASSAAHLVSVPPIELPYRSSATRELPLWLPKFHLNGASVLASIGPSTCRPGNEAKGLVFRVPVPLAGQHRTQTAEGLRRAALHLVIAHCPPADLPSALPRGTLPGEPVHQSAIADGAALVSASLATVRKKAGSRGMHPLEQP